MLYTFRHRFAQPQGLVPDIDDQIPTAEFKSIKEMFDSGVCTCVRVCIHICMCACACVCVCMSMCVCMCVCMRMCTCMCVDDFDTGMCICKYV